jgi:hypothetical protein
MVMHMMTRHVCLFIVTDHSGKFLLGTYCLCICEVMSVFEKGLVLALSIIKEHFFYWDPEQPGNSEREFE